MCTVALSAPGTYIYSSETDCLDGNRTATFDCGPYTVVVTSAPPSSVAAPATGPATAAPVTSDDRLRRFGSEQRGLLPAPIAQRRRRHAADRILGAVERLALVRRVLPLAHVRRVIRG